MVFSEGVGMILPDEFWVRIKPIQRIHQKLYAVGMGWLIGRFILLLTHTGRKSGKRYVTPLQYERIAGAYYVGAGRGQRSDWFRNVEADRHVHVQVGRYQFDCLAEPVTDPGRIVVFLKTRFDHHPWMMSLMMRIHRLPLHPDETQLGELAGSLGVVVLRPVEKVLADTQSGYDAIAEEYAREMFHELDHKPRDCELLQELIFRVRSLGLICDMGCGPGEVARFLKDCGADALGLDLSQQMVAVARRLSPDIPFQQGNMLSLDVPDASWGGIAAFYSIIHIPPGRVPAALSELRRVLKPGGWLLITFHIGDEVKQIRDWWGKPVSLDFAYFQPEEMWDYLQKAGFEEIEVNVREPYTGVEYQSRRAYIFARKPG